MQSHKCFINYPRSTVIRTGIHTTNNVDRVVIVCKKGNATQLTSVSHMYCVSPLDLSARHNDQWQCVPLLL